MTDDQANASELADRLDNALPPGRNAPIHADDHPSVQAALRLANAPQLTLATGKKAQLLSQVLAAHGKTVPAPRTYRIPPKTPLLLAVASVVIVIVVVLLVILPALNSTSDDPGEELVVEPSTSTPVHTLTTTPIPTTVVPSGVETEEITSAPPTDTAPVETTPEATEDPNPAEIVIVGPVSEIRDNVIVIYDFEFILEPSHPLLTVVRLNDVLRIEGDIEEQDDSFIIIAIQVTAISTDIYVGDDFAWRDSGNCQNPPPPQAPANGWRARCGGSGGGNGGGSGSDS